MMRIKHYLDLIFDFLTPWRRGVIALLRSQLESVQTRLRTEIEEHLGDLRGDTQRRFDFIALTATCKELEAKNTKQVAEITELAALNNWLEARNEDLVKDFEASGTRVLDASKALTDQSERYNKKLIENLQLFVALRDENAEVKRRNKQLEAKAQYLEGALLR